MNSPRLLFALIPTALVAACTSPHSTDPLYAQDDLLGDDAPARISSGDGASEYVGPFEPGEDDLGGDSLGREADLDQPYYPDLTGTNPTLFLRTVGASTEVRRLADGDYGQFSVPSFIQPFADGRARVSVDLPVSSVDSGVRGETGLGDASARVDWLASLTDKAGIVLGAELVADTASDRVLGRGVTTLAPSITYSMFLSEHDIFAPSYSHEVSIDERARSQDVEMGVIGLYYVHTSQDFGTWLKVDPEILIDYEDDSEISASLAVEHGWRIGTAWDGGLNLFVRPAIGFGDGRTSDWSFLMGVSVVNL